MAVDTGKDSIDGRFNKAFVDGLSQGKSRFEILALMRSVAHDLLKKGDKDFIDYAAERVGEILFRQAFPSSGRPKLSEDEQEVARAKRVTRAYTKCRKQTVHALTSAANFLDDKMKDIPDPDATPDQFDWGNFKAIWPRVENQLEFKDAAE